MTTHTNILQFIKAVLATRGKDTLNDLADRLDIEYNTFVNNVRYMAEKNKYNTPFARKLVRELGISLDRFAEMLETGSTEDLEQLTIVNDRIDDFESLSRQYRQEITGLLRSLRNGDSYTLITSTYPWEFDDEDMKELLIECLKAGARFQYIYPEASNNEVETFFKGYLHRYEDWAQLEERHELFLKEMMVLTESETYFQDREEYKRDGQKYLKDRLGYLTSTDPFLIHPFFNFVYMEKNILGKKRYFAFAEGKTGDMRTLDEKAFWFPLAKKQTQALRKKVQEITIFNKGK